MLGAPRATLAYQDSPGDRYVVPIGLATIIEDRSEMRSLWQGDWGALFPPGLAEANMVVAQAAVDRIEIHARGITAEPFGHGRTWLERTSDVMWCLVP